MIYEHKHILAKRYGVSPIMSAGSDLIIEQKA
jgi:hypothetical protein